MCRDAGCQLLEYCAFKPIPYELTDSGYRLLRQIATERAIANCSHRWAVEGSMLACISCGFERAFPDVDHLPSFARGKS